MIQDIRFAFRMLAKNPGFTIVAVLSLALGAGANSAMFSLADALILRPLPVKRPSQVVTIVSQTGPFTGSPLSYADYRDLRDHSKTLRDMVAATLYAFAYASTPEAQAKVKYGMVTTGNLFDAMGVRPELGRTFRPDEDQVPGRDAVVVLGYDFWKNEFAGDKGVLGRTIRLNGIDFTVIGVAPEEFTGLDQYMKCPMFVPIMMLGRLNAKGDLNILEHREDRQFQVKGRLAPGTDTQQADVEIAALGKNLAAAYPAIDKDQRFNVRTELQVRMDRSPPDAAIAAMLMVLAIAVLFVACLNVANLLLSRARARSREVAVRLAMGASRFRLIRQLLTESLLIALCGGVCGLLFGNFAMSAFRTFRIPSDLPFAFHVVLDYRVLGVTLAASMVAVLLFGLAPALQISRPDLVPALKSADADSSGKRRVWGRNALVVAQVAISLVLLVITAVLYHGFNRLLNSGVGWRTDHMMTMSFDPTLVRYTPVQTQDFYRRLIERAAQTPGVKSAALTTSIPMQPSNRQQTTFVPEGYQIPGGLKTLQCFSDSIDENYISTIGMTMIAGRTFRAGDNADAPRVVMVNDTLAKKYWPNQDALGKRMRLNSPDGPWAEVVGVVKTVKYLWIAEPPLEYIYLPYRQTQPSSLSLIAQSEGGSSSIAQPLREAVRGLDPNLPIYDVRTIEEFFEMRAISLSEMILNTIGAMGLSALLLAMFGLYGLVAYSVSRRTREFGIRMAIGASSGNVSRMVLGQGMTLGFLGVGIGAVLAFVADRGVKAVFYSSGTDWLVFLAAPALLFALTALAAYGPARRASRIDPMKALRYE